jgi:hypothetical protein
VEYLVVDRARDADRGAHPEAPGDVRDVDGKAGVDSGGSFVGDGDLNAVLGKLVIHRDLLGGGFVRSLGGNEPFALPRLDGRFLGGASPAVRGGETVKAEAVHPKGRGPGAGDVFEVSSQGGRTKLPPRSRGASAARPRPEGVRYAISPASLLRPERELDPGLERGDVGAIPRAHRPEKIEASVRQRRDVLALAVASLWRRAACSSPDGRKVADPRQVVVTSNQEDVPRTR